MRKTCLCVRWGCVWAQMRRMTPLFLLRVAPSNGPCPSTSSCPTTSHIGKENNRVDQHEMSNFDVRCAMLRHNGYNDNLQSAPNTPQNKKHENACTTDCAHERCKDENDQHPTICIQIVTYLYIRSRDAINVIAINNSDTTWPIVLIRICCGT